jgi:aminoglycoside 6'-N-acetyltransferase
MQAVASADTYDFIPLVHSHLPLVRSWLGQLHVARWFSEGPDEALEHIRAHIDDPAIDCFLVQHKGRPIGYIQAYDPFAEPDHPYRDQPAGTVGIDQFIGERDLIGRGHGPRFIDQLVRNRFALGAPHVVTDPDPTNASAIRAYGKAGFVPIEERTTPWGRVLLMTRDRGDGGMTP